MDRPNGLKTLIILVACLVMLGVMQTEAHAVAGKTVTAMAGLALAEVTLEFELTDGTSVTAQVDQQGNVELPENVNQQTVRNCYRKEQTSTGETKQRIECAGWLPAGSAAAGGVMAANQAAPHQHSILRRLADTELHGQIGGSVADGLNSTSTGTTPGGPAFLNGAGSSNASGFSYNLTLRHHFDRFMPQLGGGRPFAYFQGSSFNGVEGTGGAGVSGTGLDRTALTREINYAYGGGIGFSYPFACQDGFHGGDNCYEISPHVGVKMVSQQVSASADEAGNIRSFENNFRQLVPSGGLMFTSPSFVRGVRLVLTYDLFALNSAGLSGTSSFNNNYTYQSDGGLVHNVWLGLSFNLGKVFCESP